MHSTKTNMKIAGSLYKGEKPDLLLYLPMPPSVNECYANTHHHNKPRVKSKKYLKWISEAQSCCWEFPKKRFRSEVATIYSFYVPDKRRRDCANYEKTLSDFLVKQDYLLDDKFIRWNLQEWLDEEPRGTGAVVKIYQLSRPPM